MGHKSDAWIVEQFEERRKQSSSIIEVMRQTQELVGGRVIIPLPEMDRDEQPAVANLTAEAIDQLGMRVASSMPTLLCPPLKPRSKSSQEEALRRKLGLKTYWEENRMNRLQRRRARFLVGYGSSPVSLHPDVDRATPVWNIRSPLTCFPHPEEFYDELHPCDAIFAYRRSVKWVKERYPAALMALYNNPDEIKPTDMVEILEYHDAEEIIQLAVKVREDWYFGDVGGPVMTNRMVRLERIANRAGIPLVVTPTRMTLDQVAGQFTQLIGMHQAQARLMALELIAIEKGVFPDMVLEPSTPNVTPQLIGGQWKDGRSGEINVVRNGRVQVVQVNPGVQTVPVMDLLERNQRVGGGIPAQWGGEVPTNTRTGRAGEVTMSATVDFRVQELQETLADTLAAENRVAMRLAKAWFGDRPRSFHVSIRARGGKDLPADFTPNKDFTTDENIVEYAMPGTDINGLIVGVGQRVGTGLMSKATGRELDPLIKDADLEGDLVRIEALEQAMIASIQKLASEGSIPPEDLAYIEKLHVEQNKPIYEAIEMAQKRAQERQATPAPQGDPATQPGLSMPGMGAEQPVAPEPTVGAPDDGLFNVKKLLMSLAQPSSPSGGAPQPQVAGPRSA